MTEAHVAALIADAVSSVEAKLAAAKTGTPAKGSPEAKARMAKVRAARKTKSEPRTEGAIKAKVAVDLGQVVARKGDVTLHDNGQYVTLSKPGWKNHIRMASVKASLFVELARIAGR